MIRQYMRNTLNWFANHPALLAILVISWVLRICLAARGGQFYWPDEFRYMRSWNLLSHVFAETADWQGAIDYLLECPDHTGFVLVGAVPAVVHHTSIRFLALPIDFASIVRTSAVAAMLLATASVACIALTYAAARRAGADRNEALLAAFFMACANTMFYYSRHLLPYDSSMAFGLAALCYAINSRSSWFRSSLVGLLCSLAFLTYNGYWLFAGTVMGIHVIRGVPAKGEMARRAAVTGIAFLALPGLLALASLIRNTKPYLSGMLEFSRTVKLGDFAEGWSLPWMYFWHAEHGTLVFWSAGAMLVLWQFVTESKRAGGAVYSRGLLWLGATALVYALLLLLSCGLERFVVYGRLARQMVPFACLMAAHGWVALGGRRHLTRRACWLGLLCLSGQAAANFARPFQQQFPLEVQRQVHHGYQFVARATTIDGTAVDGDGLQSRYILVNAQHFYAVQGIKPAPQGTILLRVSHPLGFIPYQYEQFTRAERAILRNADITIRLVDLYGRTP